MHTLKTQAEVQSYGYQISYYTHDDVIRWADHIIETCPIIEIPRQIYDISLSKNKKIERVLEWLEDIPGETEENLPRKILLGHFYHEVTKEPAKLKEIISLMDRLVAVNTQYDELTFEVIPLTDGYGLAEDIYGDIDRAAQAIIDFLAGFKDYATCKDGS
ncbi:hypothetical protein [Brevibacillus dissolubilis]|uniref:hypothetical protein n=1 Tax=Brevibacillus dissolubilis TaxID=1844116 RepID=UPI00111772F6|nr:hypothetical protein [Brevibacillus dissolubilis]